MNTEKQVLTAQIAAAYWGAQVEGTDVNNPNFGSEIGKIYELSDNSITICKENGDLYEYGIFECQLLLTPLSRISDEHAIEVAKIDDKNTEYTLANGHHREITRYEFVRTFLEEKVFIGIDRFSRNTHMGYEPLPLIASLYSPEQTDFLRSKGYDCGHGSIKSLITAGIAKEIQ